MFSLFTEIELREAVRAIASTRMKSEKAILKLNFSKDLFLNTKKIKRKEWEILHPIG